MKLMNKGLKLNSIRAKLIISLIAICIIPLNILGFGSYIQSKLILNNKLTVTSSQTVAEVNSGLNDYFKEFITMTTMASNNYDAVNADDGNNFGYVPDLIKNIKESDKDILDVYYGTESGKFCMYPETKLPDGYDARQRGWYKLALQHKGQVVVTEPYQDAGTGSMVVGIAKAVERNGQVVGVIGLDCSLQTLAEKVGSKKIGNTGYIFISEPSGNIIAHPDKDVLNTDGAAKLPIWDKVKSEDKGFMSYDYNGAKKFGVYETNKLTGWKLVAILDESEISNDTKSILLTTLGIITVIALISFGMSILLSRGISRNIKMLKEVFTKASNGDLTVTVQATTKDEFHDLALSFNSMMENILALMKNVTESSETVIETSTSLSSMSEEITASISEVAKAIEDVSSGATEQVENAQNGVTQMEELSKKLDEISTNSMEMNKISTETKDLSSKGLYMIDSLSEKSNETKLAATEVSHIVQNMNESTKQINAISETIASITEQTNLLSLNASIESARAGEAGKGFAVVAEEIRKLAEESKTSTGEIKIIIESIQEKSVIAAKAIKSTENAVTEQELVVNEAKQIFSEILKSIELMINKVNEIKVSVSDMDKKKEATVSKISNISFVSEQTASASEEVTASVEEINATMEELTKHSINLNVLAEQLDTQISKFKLK
jgi:methyl-accepting chemotaxis protein